MRLSNYELYEKTLSVIIQQVDIKSQTAEARYQSPSFFTHLTRCWRRSFRNGSHCSIGPGPELGQVQWRDRRYSHWFGKYHGANRRSSWTDLGDPRPCGRREAGREHPTRRPGPP